MIITKTPLRISFFGGGTDYPAYYEAHGGEVLSTSIDQYVYLTVSRLNPLFEHRIRVAYSRTELVREVAEIEHPSVRGCLRHLGLESGLEISVTADLPARTGLGSSSAFTVGLLHALHAQRGELLSREALAREAIHVEQKVIGERVGSQDQVGTAIGGFNRIHFSKDAGFSVEPLPLPDERRRALQHRLLLYFTGLARYAEDILDEQCERVNDNLATLARMRGHVAEATRIVCNPAGDLDDFGRLLDEGWRLKRSLSSKVSNSSVDAAYAAAKRVGALGGKLLGAGGGGFLLLYAAPDAHESIAAALPSLTRVPFSFENGGTQLIYYRN